MLHASRWPHVLPGYGSSMCGRLDLRPEERREGSVGRFHRAARNLTISNLRPSPMQAVPLICGLNNDALAARWGWPSGKGLHVHARREEAAARPTWRQAWRTNRGVIPVTGWWEGSWYCTGADLHLAVLWRTAGAGAAPAEGTEVVVLTQSPGRLGDRFERLPVSLTERGALAWLTGGSSANRCRTSTVALRVANSQSSMRRPFRLHACWSFCAPGTLP
jgi:putative SOS response-associated peptidase YedK